MKCSYAAALRALKVVDIEIHLAMMAGGSRVPSTYHFVADKFMKTG
jgi:hypothetical protein